MGFLTTSLEGGNFRVSLADGGELFLETAPSLPGTGTVTNVTGSAPIVITGSPTATPNVTIVPATDSVPGSMSAADKTKIDQLAVPAAPALSSPAVQALAAIGGSALIPGLTLVSIAFTPTGSGRTLIGLTMTGASNIVDYVNATCLVRSGSAASGGTVVGGVRYYQGGSPVITVTAGTIVIVPAFQAAGSVVAAGGNTWGVALTGLCNLVAGTPYIIQFLVSGTTAAAYAAGGILCNAFAAELE